jgi:hypothetical protein
MAAVDQLAARIASINRTAAQDPLPPLHTNRNLELVPAFFYRDPVLNQNVPSIARVAAGEFGFLTLIQLFDGPL